MLKKYSAIIAVLILVSCFVGCANVPTTREFDLEIVNQTGVTITELTVSGGNTIGSVNVPAGTRIGGLTYNNTGPVNQVARPGGAGVGNQANIAPHLVRGSTDQNTGQVIHTIEWRRADMANGGSVTRRFTASGTMGEPPTRANITGSVAIRATGSNGVIYSVANANVQTTSRFVITEEHRNPSLIVQNDTGFPIAISSPRSQAVANGRASMPFSIQTRGTSENFTISYSSGLHTLQKEATVQDRDVTLTLTDADRPPRVRVVNNTGQTIINVQLRRSGTDEWSVNVISIQLEEDGSARLDAAGGVVLSSDLASSITNNDGFNFWMGNLRLPLNETYDIRLISPTGTAFTKRNTQISSDVTLTFTSADGA
ncbi:MAG: hypothetical protein FWG98_14185 [Candidatus Cloacimonetes bacterium]|nr:hypothetical protein [Candidatus Cloacimonadota bacterium]